MVSIVCLGNEFMEGDSLAKEVGVLLKEDFDIINIRDSFQLMELLNEREDIVLLDVVEGLTNVRELSVEEVRVDSILSAHDFDAGYVLKLVGSRVKIIGISSEGDLRRTKDEVVALIKSN